MRRKYPVRSSQLIAPFGVGAMIVKKGISLIVAGCDSWFPSSEEAAVNINSTGNQFFDESEFVIREHRLEARLGVSGFRVPPDYRESRRNGRVIVPNSDLTVSVLRFPQWHFCSRCGLMEFLPLTQDGKAFCKACPENFHIELAQMSFVAICERGHLQDFPWREWAHRSHHPSCTGDLYYVRSGSGTLAGQKVKCACGEARSLRNVDKANYSDTYLSFYLSKSDGIFFCRGHRPWLAETVDAKCSAYLRGNPRNAGNVWFSETVSAIYLPQTGEEHSANLLEFLSRPDVRAKIKALTDLGEKNTGGLLKIIYPTALTAYDAAQIEAALLASARDANRSEPVLPQTVSIGNPETEIYAGSRLPTATSGETSEEEFRYPEYMVLRENQDEETLLSHRINLVSPASTLSTFFSRLVQIHRLRETRAFTGFSRIFSDNALPLEERKAMLRAARPGNASTVPLTRQGEKMFSSDWLPASTVYGEGIYLELNQDRLSKWLTRNGAAFKKHLAPLEAAAATSKIGNRGSSSVDVSAANKTSSGSISPVFVLIHTLAHLLINQLTFESGYGAAALRERIYFSENKRMPTAAVLIYTADGDSEGTLGGLVRLGTPDNLDKLLKRALADAGRCALDPYCSEIGIASGQGPDNCNLAACHACTLLAETSCEEFNKFLDRSLLVNLADSTIEGFFETA